MQDNIKDELIIVLRRHGITSHSWTEVEGEVELRFDKAINLQPSYGERINENIRQNIPLNTASNTAVQIMPNEPQFQKPMAEDQQKTQNPQLYRAEPVQTSKVVMEKTSVRDSGGSSPELRRAIEEYEKRKNKKATKITEV